MNIPIESVAKAVNKGVDIKTFIQMKCIEDGCLYLFQNNDCFGLSNPFYIQNDKLTIKGKQVLVEIEGVKEVYSKIDNKYELLHKKLQTELTTLTNKKQKNLQGKYPFLPNSKDLATRLSKIIKKYKLDDWNRVEKLLIDYIYTCHKANFQFTPTLEYYIEKNSSSKLVTDYENFEEKETEKKLEKEELQPKEIKDLF